MEISVVKIGGNVIDNPEALRCFVEKFAVRTGKKILIHGGGKVATSISTKLGIPTKIIDGRRITDWETVRVVTMVYAGLINKTLVSQLQALGCNALGLSGADAGLIKAVKRNPKPIDFGYVGDVPVECVNAKQLLNFIDGELVPVLCSITADKDGTLLNCNADTIAQSVAVALSQHHQVELIYCFDKKGLLADVNDDNSAIPVINPENCAKLKADGVISDGMIPKIDNAFAALNAGVKKVVIKSYSDVDNDKGTIIKPD
jgi:acetylglutamate kinase